VFNQDILLRSQAEALEESIWVSIRMLEERRNLLLNIANQQNGYPKITDDNTSRAQAINVHIERLKAVLLSIHRQDTIE
jgi:two-component system chemotaxis response regulator CheB